MRTPITRCPASSNSGSTGASAAGSCAAAGAGADEGEGARNDADERRKREGREADIEQGRRDIHDEERKRRDEAQKQEIGKGVLRKPILHLPDERAGAPAQRVAERGLCRGKNERCADCRRENDGAGSDERSEQEAAEQRQKGRAGQGERGRRDIGEDKENERADKIACDKAFKRSAIFFQRLQRKITVRTGRKHKSGGEEDRGNRQETAEAAPCVAGFFWHVGHGSSSPSGPQRRRRDLTASRGGVTETTLEGFRRFGAGRSQNREWERENAGFSGLPMLDAPAPLV